MDENETTLADWVIIQKYRITHLSNGSYGAKIKKPYRGARIWTTEVEHTYLKVTWVPTSMGPEPPATQVDEDTFHREDDA